MEPSHQPYRRDIDGLRALAVLAVILYHAFPNLLPGGYLGVDVFFVISGFVITRSIWPQLCDGNFSYAHCYGNRIRRIFPALASVMALKRRSSSLATALASPWMPTVIFFTKPRLVWSASTWMILASLGQ